MSQILLMFLGLLAAIPVLLLVWLIPALLGGSLSSGLVGSHVASRNFKVSILSLTIVLLVLFSVFILIPSIRPHMFSIVPLGLSFFILISLLSYIPNNLRSGTCLLNIGYTNNHKILMALGSFMIVILIYAVVKTQLDEKNINSREIPTLVMNFFMSLYFLAQGLIPLQVRQHGILWLNFTKWESIKDYHWEPDKPIILTLTKRTLFGITQKMSLPIPIMHKDEFEKIIFQKISKANTG